MEKCAKLLIDATSGQVKEIVGEVSCTVYPEWFMWTCIGVQVVCLVMLGIIYWYLRNR
jgi:hypothetical protein